jgi:hypothetical protein
MCSSLTSEAGADVLFHIPEQACLIEAIGNTSVGAFSTTVSTFIVQFIKDVLLFAGVINHTT